MPKARMVYVSATGASELTHMSYMDRLGLWGEGTAFVDAHAFIGQIEKRGMGAMEMVAIGLGRIVVPGTGPPNLLVNLA